MKSKDNFIWYFHKVITHSFAETEVALDRQKWVKLENKLYKDDVEKNNNFYIFIISFLIIVGFFGILIECEHIM